MLLFHLGKKLVLYRTSSVANNIPLNNIKDGSKVRKQLYNRQINRLTSPINITKISLKKKNTIQNCKLKTVHRKHQRMFSGPNTFELIRCYEDMLLFKTVFFFLFKSYPVNIIMKHCVFDLNLNFPIEI